MKDIMESVSKSEGDKMIRSILYIVVDTAVQESKVKAILADIKEYRLENIIMKVMRKEERLARNILTKSDRWSQDEGLADILARMEKSVCVMDTTKQEMIKYMVRDSICKVEEDVNMDKEDAKDAGEVDGETISDECLNYQLQRELCQGWL